MRRSARPRTVGGRAGALLLLLALAACGRPRPPCTFAEDGVCYLVEAGHPSAAALRQAHDQSEGVWGAGVLSGWTVRLAAETGCTASSDACALLDDREIVIRWVSRCSLALLIHETGHAAAGDLRHLDPRWAEATEVMVWVERQCRNTPEGEED